MTRVAVVDYGLGNLHSVVKALRHLGADVKISTAPDEVAGAERLVLPGVGAFADGMRGLRERGLIEPIHQFIGTGRPFLGICLGMQLLLTESDEFGLHGGLDVIPGRVEALPRDSGAKVPHIGWNRIQPRTGGAWAGTPLAPLDHGAMVYFVHSFTAVPRHEEHRLADTWYAGTRVSAAVKRDNVTGCQFHPEKSGPVGLDVLRCFLAG